MGWGHFFQSANLTNEHAHIFPVSLIGEFDCSMYARYVIAELPPNSFWRDDDIFHKSMRVAELPPPAIKRRREGRQKGVNLQFDLINSIGALEVIRSPSSALSTV